MYIKRFRLYMKTDVELYACKRKDGELILRFIMADDCKNIFSKKKKRKFRPLAAHIHKSDYDSVKDFTRKIKKIISELKNFYFFLREKHNFTYNHRVWLNKNNNPSTGSLVCYYGPSPFYKREENIKTLFIELGDCHNKIRILFPIMLKKEEWVIKERTFDDLRKLCYALEDFVKHIETEYGEEK